MNVDLRRDPPDYSEYQEHGRRWPFVLLAVALTFVVFAGSGALWVQHQVNPPGGTGPQERVTVAPGMSTSDIASLLERKGVIASATVFKYYARLTGLGSIEAGDYTLAKRSDLADVAKVLEAGAAKANDDRVTIPEGLGLPRIAQLVGEQLPGRSAAKFLEVAKSGAVRSQYQPAGAASLEGFILPETYFVSKTDDETAVLKKMVDAFDQLATQLNVTGAAARFGITPYQAVIVASLVEREARVDEDRGKVARVIYNRLDAKMPLQIDATVLYALNKPQESLSFKDLEIDSPYNTYKIPGLPPGPIANPGRKSLEAATTPAAGNWTFYVLADASGRHAFTADYREFQNLRNQCIAKGLCG